MEKTVRIKGSKDSAEFFDKVLANKKERKEKIRRKFKNGELTVV